MTGQSLFILGSVSCWKSSEIEPFVGAPLIPRCSVTKTKSREFPEHKFCATFDSRRLSCKEQRDLQHLTEKHVCSPSAESLTAGMHTVLPQRNRIDTIVCGNTRGIHLQSAHDVARLEISRGHQKLGDELDLLVLRFVALYSGNVPELPASMGDRVLSKKAWRTLQSPG